MDYYKFFRPTPGDKYWLVPYQIKHKSDSHKHQPLTRNKTRLKINSIYKKGQSLRIFQLKIVLNDLSQTTANTLVLKMKVNN